MVDAPIAVFHSLVNLVENNIQFTLIFYFYKVQNYLTKIIELYTIYEIKDTNKFISNFIINW